MDEAARSAWCREQGLYPAELEAWKRDAIAGLGEPRAASAVEARQDRRRGKELEGELHRKGSGHWAEGRWPRRAPWWWRQKRSGRASATARTHDPTGRPPEPGC